MDLQQLKTLSELKYQNSQRALSDVLNRENELRGELERMRVLYQQTQSQDPQDAELRALGADIIWLKWLGRVQRELNISLATVLAQKEVLIATHRQATGRKHVAEDLAEQQADARRTAKSKTQLKSAIENTLFRQSD